MIWLRLHILSVNERDGCSPRIRSVQPTRSNWQPRWYGATSPHRVLRSFASTNDSLMLLVAKASRSCRIRTDTPKDPPGNADHMTVAKFLKNPLSPFVRSLAVVA